VTTSTHASARPHRPHVIKSADARCPGQYLKAYDPEAHDGRGKAEWTADRPDGRPNRPLTAFTVTFDLAS